MTTLTAHESAQAEARAWVHEHYPWMDRAGDVLHRAARWRQYGPAIQRLVAEVKVVYEDVMDDNVDDLAAIIEDGDTPEAPTGRGDALAEFRARNPGIEPREIVARIDARWAYFREHGRFPR